MIVKAGPDLRGSRTYGLLSYLLGPGRHTVHTDPRVIGGWLPLDQLPDAELDPTGRVDYVERIDVNGTVRRYPKVTALAAALDAPVKAVSEARRPGRPVWHCIVSNDPKVDPVLSDGRWAAIADEIVASVGLQDCRWVAVRHDDHGIHIAATLVDENGRRPRLSFEKTKLNECRTRLEAQHCRRRTDPGTRTGGVAYQRHEVEKARREGRTAPAKTMLRRAINTAVVATDNPADFRAFLSRHGVQVGWRFSTTYPGEITGYKVALAGHTTAAGEPIWYKASDVDRALTWPKIQARWACPRSDNPARPDAATVNDYAARMVVTANQLREKHLRAGGLQGSLSDLATALAGTRPELRDLWWTGESSSTTRTGRPQPGRCRYPSLQPHGSRLDRRRTLPAGCSRQSPQPSSHLVRGRHPTRRHAQRSRGSP